MTKMIIHNVTDIPDDVAIEMVLRVVQEGRANPNVSYKPHSKFNGCYHVDAKKSCSGFGTDVFWITKDDVKK